MSASELFLGIEPWLQQLERATGLPRSVAAALVALVTGLCLAALLRFLVRKLLVRVERSVPWGKAYVEEVVGRHRGADVIAQAVYWIVLLVFTMAATELLGLRVVTQWLGGLTSFVPRLLVALVAVTLGIVLGRVSRRAVSRAAQSAGLPEAGRLGRLIQPAIIVASLLVAAEQLGIHVQFVTTALMIALAALLGGAALAFGLGGRPIVASILAGHYVRKLYDVGQVIRVDGVEGRILRITPTAVILDAADGETAVPSGELLSVRSTLVARGGS